MGIWILYLKVFLEFIKCSILLVWFLGDVWKLWVCMLENILVVWFFVFFILVKLFVRVSFILFFGLVMNNGLGILGFKVVLLGFLFW